MKISYDHFKECRPQNKSLKTILKGNDFRYKKPKIMRVHLHRLIMLTEDHKR